MIGSKENADGDESGAGFQVLLEGEEGSDKAGQYYVWSTDATGEIKKGSGWLSQEKAIAAGWEDLFNQDLDKDSITGLSNNPGISLGFDGLKSKYLLDDPDSRMDPIVLKNAAGNTLSAASSQDWDAVAASFLGTGQGFQVLLQGEEDTAVEGMYRVLNTDIEGREIAITSWKDDLFASSNWFDRFGSGFNPADLVPTVEFMV